MARHSTRQNKDLRNVSQLLGAQQVVTLKLVVRSVKHLHLLTNRLVTHYEAKDPKEIVPTEETFKTMK
ncbi:hypothetical protein MJO28_006524 [Puccinia striiformis f. sp. tritici]|uniref:Uncharacterized protein n=1 Tax=Puccinia striiformis f. sp. tritici TaxID=168172 RepID=A0ACC0EJE8_9BASI|nr:hypothetical protein MJO28_006524 [Puccinia striiformis f. sp. tritici]